MLKVSYLLVDERPISAKSGRFESIAHVLGVICLIDLVCVSVKVHPALHTDSNLHWFICYQSLGVTYCCRIYLIYRKPAAAPCPECVT